MVLLSAIGTPRPINYLGIREVRRKQSESGEASRWKTRAHIYKFHPACMQKEKACPIATRAWLKAKPMCRHDTPSLIRRPVCQKCVKAR